MTPLISKADVITLMCEGLEPDAFPTMANIVYLGSERLSAENFRAVVPIIRRLLAEYRLVRPVDETIDRVAAFLKNASHMRSKFINTADPDAEFLAAVVQIIQYDTKLFKQR